MKIRIIPEIIAGKMSSITLAASLCIAFTVNSATAGSIERISTGSEIVSTGNSPKASDNGRYIVFRAYSTNTPSYQINTYLHDRATDVTELVSVGNDGSAGVAGGSIDVSNDGRYVVFIGRYIDGNGNVNVYVRDRATNTTELVSINSDGSPGTVTKSASAVSISGDGRYVAFISNSADVVSGDTNGVADVFVRDRVTGVTQRVSIASDGTQANGKSGGNYRGTDISADGRYIVFSSVANNLVPNDTNDKLDLFIHDRTNGTTARVNLANDGSQISAGHYGWFDLSSDGRYITFVSGDSNLVTNDNNGQADVFVRDLAMDTTELVSFANDGSQSNSLNTFPGISANGRYVSFNSSASNLVTGGNPQGLATFVRDRIANTTEMVDTPHDGTVANHISFGNSAVSGDGRYVVFASFASNLVAGDSDINNDWDIFIHDRISGQICQ
ncbi:MAG: hypothetical protein L3J84_04830 [Gammaproteobacteria bacterium]|nr:hypothetical protein [Gammaproteobacteria bacterium]